MYNKALGMMDNGGRIPFFSCANYYTREIALISIFITSDFSVMIWVMGKRTLQKSTLAVNLLTNVLRKDEIILFMNNVQAFFSIVEKKIYHIKVTPSPLPVNNQVNSV